RYKLTITKTETRLKLKADQTPELDARVEVFARQIEHKMRPYYGETLRGEFSLLNMECLYLPLHKDNGKKVLLFQEIPFEMKELGEKQ
ncbi:MAG: hypothetical protein NTZ24_06230, partial [Deltaproteobacteria bacterium]|nr:hypothetical protein [Deltaproteobacteria bacterium]